MISRVTAGNDEVATVILDRDSPSFYEIQSGGELYSTVNFLPQRRITIETELLLINGASISSFPLDFNVARIPEPACGLLLMMGLISVGSSYRAPRKRHQTPSSFAEASQ